jgi:hypothetical protein
MAYGIYIRALEDELINKLIHEAQLNFSDLVNTGYQKQIITTHYFVSNGCGILEFDDIFLKCIDGGKDLNVTPHIFRPPRFYFSHGVKRLNEELKLKWDEVRITIPISELEFFLLDFNPILEVYEFASKNNLAVLSYIET